MKTKILHGFSTTAGAGLLAVASLLFTSGCLAVVAGAGAGAAVAYVRGDLQASLDASFGQALIAANQAVQQLQFAKVSEKKDALEGTIIARNADDKKIEIRLENAGAEVAKVSIRVGTFGNETLSLTVLEKIKANL